MVFHKLSSIEYAHTIVYCYRLITCYLLTRIPISLNTCIIFQGRKTDFPLKSPGIRPITAKHLGPKHGPFPLPFGSMRSEDEREAESSSPHNTTPSTPTTPLSPPHNGDNVFEPVTIGQGNDK